MGKRSKKARVPVPSINATPARSQCLGTEDASDVHLKYINDHWELIAAISWKEYLAHGRGALIFQVEPKSDGDWNCVHTPLREVQTNCPTFR